MPTQKILSVFTLFVFLKQPYFETLSMNELQHSSTLTSGDQFPIVGLRLEANAAFLLPAP